MKRIYPLKAKVSAMNLRIYPSLTAYVTRLK